MGNNVEWNNDDTEKGNSDDRGGITSTLFSFKRGITSTHCEEPFKILLTSDHEQVPNTHSRDLRGPPGAASEPIGLFSHVFVIIFSQNQV